MKLPLQILILTIFTACSSIKPLEVKFRSIEGSGFYSTSAATKSSLVREKNDQQIICSEPAPDATYNEQDNSSIGLSFLHIGDKTSEALADGETEGGLGGRSVNVLLTREMYFRMCEFFANSNLNDSLKIEIYDRTLKSILQLNSINFGKGTISGSTSQASLTGSNALLLPNNTLPADSTTTKAKSDDSDKEDDDNDF